ncbi:3-hydroxyacyl-CoA dehydrogenase [Leeia sp. TBRC 13508]|uniref:3-hydroxyacyl-CoA dehydrogenase n=1 Tax=Leeia speluncae TaxID=2884804 RepID=A0ABS8DB04_9NEIS|nr:3-hydroxyacyl-CoA dehydrogenase NAD-binding domain-containing protein [Leeia speluncae]MCB6185375.1 3-hydroxyacyl-CoA dehydrogenase [Leeia speluncae]
MLDILKNELANKVVSIVGAGLIGRSWAALFAAAGFTVKLYDSQPGTKALMESFWTEVKPTLIELGLATSNTNPTFHVTNDIKEAVIDVDFIQECIPERLDAKLALYQQMEPYLKSNAVIATSSSGLKLSDLQAGFKDPSRIIIAHPFNPPHLIPLVELYTNEKTASGVLDVAESIYSLCGKVTIRLKKEVLAHVANRLQAALWREAIHLVLDGVASLKDVDLAVSAGPGLRWGVMGPHALLNLGGGEGGLRAYCQQFRDSYHLWWDDLGKPQLTDEAIDKLVAEVKEHVGDKTYLELKQDRDSKLVAVLQALQNNKLKNQLSRSAQ